MTDTTRSFVVLGAIGLAMLVALPASSAPVIRAPRPAAMPIPNDATLAAELAGAFRIDVTDLEIRYDFWPATALVDGTATLRFRLRPGQTRALFHWNPLRRVSQRKERALLRSLRLDGEALDPQDDTDVLLIKPARGAERAFEVQRTLTPDGEHVLEIGWSSPNAPRDDPSRWFYPDFDDTEGPRRETETIWPTVSSPEELTRHRIRLAVHSVEAYTVIGSGIVRPTDDVGGVQSWEIDTVRPIASSNVFFAAVPTAEVRSVELETRGVPVTIVSDRSQPETDEAEDIVRRTIAHLVDDFGPFPMPGMQILLTGWSSGMEYYGATRTGLDALEHELVHMYFGTATVNRTWRDTWFDEAAVEWWLGRDDLDRLPSRFRSKMAADRTAVAPGFDLSAYDAGAEILGEVAQALGGNRAMIRFLRDLHRRRAFAPFTTNELIDDIVVDQDAIDRPTLERWLFGRR